MIEPRDGCLCSGSWSYLASEVRGILVDTDPATSRVSGPAFGEQRDSVSAERRFVLARRPLGLERPLSRVGRAKADPPARSPVGLPSPEPAQCKAGHGLHVESPPEGGVVGIDLGLLLSQDHAQSAAGAF